MNRSLQQWVDYIQTLHCREIELTLERVREVYLRLYPQGVPFKVVSVSGTNGKGSTSELISAIYRAAGYSVGKYTSPHLISFNERVNIQGIEIGDQALLDAFERVESVREDTTLTFFEYGTLVAIDCFVTAGVDIAVMEVGLGGRLDAVNILDAAVAVVTSISIDHTSWLGDTIEKIAVEKAGIARSNRPCLIGMQNPPASLLKECHRIGAIVRQSGKDFEFDYKSGESVWGWRSTLAEYCDLPLPYGQSGVQLSNAALALQVVTEMHEELSVTQDDIYSGLASASIFGRRQVLQKDPLIILDVAHNESSVNALAEFLSTLEVKGEVIAVCGMLKYRLSYWCFVIKVRLMLMIRRLKH